MVQRSTFTSVFLFGSQFQTANLTCGYAKSRNPYNISVGSLLGRSPGPHVPTFTCSPRSTSTHLGCASRCWLAGAPRSELAESHSSVLSFAPGSSFQPFLEPVPTFICTLPSPSGPSRPKQFKVPHTPNGRQSPPPLAAPGRRGLLWSAVCRRSLVSAEPPVGQISHCHREDVFVRVILLITHTLRSEERFRFRRLAAARLDIIHGKGGALYNPSSLHHPPAARQPGNQATRTSMSHSCCSGDKET